MRSVLSSGWRQPGAQGGTNRFAFDNREVGRLLLAEIGAVAVNPMPRDGYHQRFAPWITLTSS